MANTHKRIRGCKENPVIKVMSFQDYVTGFCNSQVKTRMIECSSCGEDSICKSATIEEDVVRGEFECTVCNVSDTKIVDMCVLKNAFNVARKGRLLAV